MTVDVLTILLVIAAALAALGFTVVPIVPGALFPVVGAIACVLLPDGPSFGWWFWVVQAAFVGVYLVIDNVAQAVGVGRIGGSRTAMAGGAFGVFVGPLLLAPVIGPFALLVGPPVGAVVGTLLGEVLARRQEGTQAATAREHVRLGTGAMFAYVLSMFVKLGLVAVQIALLAWLAWP